MNLSNSSTQFFNPRERNEQISNTNGYDSRYFASLKINQKDHRCELSCGNRKTSLKMLTFEERLSLFKTLTPFKPPSHQRAPFLHLKDEKRQIHFYIDSEFISQGNPKNFQLFKGERTQFKSTEFKLTSQNQDRYVFEIAQGKEILTITVSRIGWNQHSSATWRVKNKERKLTILPLSEAYEGMYTQKGPYAKEVFHSPCQP